MEKRWYDYLVLWGISTGCGAFYGLGSVMLIEAAVGWKANNVALIILCSAYTMLCRLGLKMMGEGRL